MPRGKKKTEGEEQDVVVAQIGKLLITRPDRYNWCVVDPGKMKFYYSDLQTAIKGAVTFGADRKSKTIDTWLEEYKRIRHQLYLNIAYLVDSIAAKIILLQTPVSTGKEKGLGAKYDNPASQNRSPVRGKGKHARD
jgi:hypothetical protein